MQQRYFKVGFTGCTRDEVLDWVVPWLSEEGVRRIVVPFAGSGKDIAAFAKEGRTIVSYDTQQISAVLVRALALNPYVCGGPLAGPKGLIGFCAEQKPFGLLDEGTARVINYIAVRGSVLDRAALVKCIIRCTLMGRLGEWASSNGGFGDFWHKWLNAREAITGHIGKPGSFVHVKGDALELPMPEDCDLMYVDPPKVLETRDLYSGKGFTALNSILEQEQVKLPKWSRDVYIPRLHSLVRRTRWNILVLFHTSGVYPTLDDLIAGMQLGPPDGVREFPEEGGRTDYAVVYRRGKEI